MWRYFYVADGSSALYYSSTTTGYVRAWTAKGARRKVRGMFPNRLQIGRIEIYRNEADYHDTHA